RFLSFGAVAGLAFLLCLCCHAAAGAAPCAARSCFLGSATDHVGRAAKVATASTSPNARTRAAPSLPVMGYLDTPARISSPSILPQLNLRPLASLRAVQGTGIARPSFSTSQPRLTAGRSAIAKYSA